LGTTHIKLSECRQGQVVTIRRVGGRGALRKRLLEMGIMSGETVRIVKYAPLRDPLELALKSSRVSLRVSEAASLEVEPLEQGAHV
jgi:Fe2+ transport system protein FeoA